MNFSLLLIPVRVYTNFILLNETLNFFLLFGLKNFYDINTF